MNIKTERTDGNLTITLEGRLDITTAPYLEAELNQNLSGVEKLLFDFSSLEYLSSAGLRVLLSAQKRMNRQGSMAIRNVRDEIMEVFKRTGFTDILTLE